MLTKILNLFAVLFGITLFSTLTFIFYKNASKNISDYQHIESNVINKGIAKSENDKDIFYLQFANDKKKFSIYSITQNYKELQDEINIDDKIKIYYEESNSQKSNFLEIIQLEKENQIIINHTKHKLIYYGFTILCLLANIYIIFMFYHYLKYGNFDNPIPPIF